MVARRLVEFALGIPIFLTVFVGMVDLARGVFMFNGVSRGRPRDRPGDERPSRGPARSAPARRRRPCSDAARARAGPRRADLLLLRHRRRAADRRVPARRLGPGDRHQHVPAVLPAPGHVGPFTVQLSPAARRSNERPNSPSRAGGQILVIFALSLIVLDRIRRACRSTAGGASRSGATSRRPPTSRPSPAPTTTSSTATSRRRSTRARTVAAAERVHRRRGGAIGRRRRRHLERRRGRRSASAAPTGTRSSASLGMATWPVSTSPAALAGFPDSAAGARPVHLLDRRVRQRRHAAATRPRPTSARRTATSRPARLDFAWTNYGTGNVNTQRGQRHHRRAPRRSTRR